MVKVLLIEEKAVKTYCYANALKFQNLVVFFFALLTIARELSKTELKTRFFHIKHLHFNITATENLEALSSRREFFL